MHPLRIAVVGSGYVGTTAIGCFTWVGHDVTGVEVDQAKLRTLRSGQAPFHEPGLDRLLEQGLSEGRLRFTDDVAGAMADCDVVFLCVGARTGPDSRMDMRAMESAAEAIGRAFKGQVIVNKSTIPVGAPSGWPQSSRVLGPTTTRALRSGSSRTPSSSAKAARSRISSTRTGWCSVATTRRRSTRSPRSTSPSSSGASPRPSDPHDRRSSSGPPRRPLK
jgi:UDP-glucose/GDP-mannose dehydrogenase family protein